MHPLVVFSKTQQLPCRPPGFAGRLASARCFGNLLEPCSCTASSGNGRLSVLVLIFGKNPNAFSYFPYFVFFRSQARDLSVCLFLIILISVMLNIRFHDFFPLFWGRKLNQSNASRYLSGRALARPQVGMCRRRLCVTGRKPELHDSY